MLSLFLLILSAVAVSPPLYEGRIAYLEAGSVVDYVPEVQYRSFFFGTTLRIYCYRGIERSLNSLFESMMLRLAIEGDDYAQYVGATPDEIFEESFDYNTLFRMNPFKPMWSTIQISPFKDVCVGIDATMTYRLQLEQTRFDGSRVVQLITALTLIFYSDHLSRNVIFYYATSAVLGVCTSFLVVTWLLCRFVARRVVMFGLLITGWTIVLFLMRVIYDNLEELLHTYKIFIIWYVSITGLISLVVCYLCCPCCKRCNNNALKWLIRLGACWLLYTTSHYKLPIFLISTVCIVMHYVSRKLNLTKYCDYLVYISCNLGLLLTVPI